MQPLPSHESLCMPWCKEFSWCLARPCFGHSAWAWSRGCHCCCSGITPRYDKPSLKMSELLRTYQQSMQGGDKSRQTTQSHWRGLRVCISYAEIKREVTVRSRDAVQEDKLDCYCVNYGSYIHAAQLPTKLSMERVRSKQYYYALTWPVLLIAYLLCWLRLWRNYDVMPRLSVRYAYEEVMCRLDSWAGWLMRRITRCPSILRDSSQS